MAATFFYKISRLALYIFRLYTKGVTVSTTSTQYVGLIYKVSFSLNLLHVPSNCFFLQHWYYSDAVGGEAERLFCISPEEGSGFTEVEVLLPGKEPDPSVVT